VPLRLFGNPNARRALYLDDFGVIFMLDTRLRLQAVESAAADKKTAVDAHSEWEEAKREIKGIGNPPEDWPMNETDSAEPYDSKQVEQLKNSVIEALKNGNHLRHLKSGDRIVVVISSQAGGDQNGMPIVSMQGPGNVRIVKTQVISDAESGDKHTLTITVKKEDVDSFAEGKISADDFRKKALIVND
jgi:hypothetical protein